jgi:hypothetical protein
MTTPAKIVSRLVLSSFAGLLMSDLLSLASVEKPRTNRYTIMYITLNISIGPATLFLATPRKKFGAGSGHPRWKPDAPASDVFSEATGPKETQLQGRLRSVAAQR